MQSEMIKGFASRAIATGVTIAKICHVRSNRQYQINSQTSPIQV
jgi:hypothetical protein